MAENNQDLPNNFSNIFNYVFNFNDENKNELMNLIQYAVLAIIPIVLILKSVKTIFPEDDENKGSIEILADQFNFFFALVESPIKKFTSDGLKYLGSIFTISLPLYDPISSKPSPLQRIFIFKSLATKLIKSLI